MKALSEANARALERFTDGLWLNDGLARNTLESYRRDLAQFAAWLDEAEGRPMMPMGMGGMPQMMARMHGTLPAKLAVTPDAVFVSRGSRLLKFGRDLELDPAPEPLLAPPEGKTWSVLWSSEDARYDGGGIVPPETEDGWRIPGEAAIVLVPEQREEKT